MWKWLRRLTVTSSKFGGASQSENPEDIKCKAEKPDSPRHDRSATIRNSHYHANHLDKERKTEP